MILLCLSWIPFSASLIKQVCHRDLKLENTLLDGSPAPRLKICDFGYSKVLFLFSSCCLYLYISGVFLWFGISSLCIWNLQKHTIGWCRYISCGIFLLVSSDFIKIYLPSLKNMVVWCMAISFSSNVLYLFFFFLLHHWLSNMHFFIFVFFS